jgi:SAM-dependent methyltransferase
MGHRIEIWQVLTKHFFARHFPADARVLDLGAGYCEFINQVAAREKVAIDQNPRMSEFAGPGVRCVISDIESALKTLGDGSLDRIMASNIFEHLPDRDYLFRCLAEALRVLSPGGKIIVMQPNIAAVRERFYDFCDHLLPLTEKGMAEALRTSGFQIETMVARFLPYTTKSRYPKWKFLVRLYLRVPLAHRFMGGQMLIIARKPC